MTVKMKRNRREKRKINDEDTISKVLEGKVN